MGAPFAFLAGIASLATSFVMACKEKAKNEKQAREYTEKRYSYAYQSKYDFDGGRKYNFYNIDKIMYALRKDYPRMNDFCARMVAEAAVAKRMMEEETPYNYQVSDRCKYFDLDKYSGDEFKRKKEE